MLVMDDHPMAPDVKEDLEAVQTHYGAFVFWENEGVVHRCGGAEVHPGVFLLWSICQEGDVPAGEGFKSLLQEPTCQGCIDALNGG
mgnify:CR=1 FL=1